MKKAFLWILIFVFCFSLLAGCGSNETGETAAATQQTQAPPVPETTQPAAVETTAPPVPELGAEDSYWVAYEWFSDEEESAEAPIPLQPEEWSMDLIIRADGTARFRDVREGLYLMEEADLNMIWEREADGTLCLYNDLYPYPVLKCTANGDHLSVLYLGTGVSMTRAPMPQDPGQLHCAAELTGTWIMTSGETEGWEWDAMPGRLSTLVFKLDSAGEESWLAADMEDRGYYGDLESSFYNLPLEILPNALYEGCENTLWSVRIGPASPVNQNGAPLEPEYYATLLDQNTLLMQQYYLLDGYPAVSYQTYQRMPERISGWPVEAEALALSHWICAEYTDASGVVHPMSKGMEDFYLQFGEGSDCQIYQKAEGNDHYIILEGTWQLYNGGAMLLQSAAEEEDFWYAGAVRGYTCEIEDVPTEAYDLYLFYEGGILHLLLDSFG